MSNTGFTALILGQIIVILSLSADLASASHGHININHELCDKGDCAPVVSYCMVQDMCNCNPTLNNCSCCNECFTCLGAKYREKCCHCIGFCDKFNFTETVKITTSTVDVCEDPNAQLFKLLTDKPVPQLRYTIVKFPVFEELAFHHHRQASSRHKHNHNIVVDQVSDMTITADWTSIEEALSASNMLCTVSYFDYCLSLDACRMSCQNMAANSYRWFHNGCCECVGPTCLNYGNPYPKCKACIN